MKKEYRRIKKFIKEHRKEILLGASIAITGSLLVHLKTVTEVALNSLNREERRIGFEIKEIYESIERLDPTAPINKFDRIPRKLKRIEELTVDLMMIQKDKKKAKRFL